MTIVFRAFTKSWPCFTLNAMGRSVVGQRVVGVAATRQEREGGGSGRELRQEALKNENSRAQIKTYHDIDILAAGRP